MRILRRLFLFRWVRSIACLLHGARVHPLCVFYVNRGRVSLGTGTRMAARSIVDVQGDGRFVTGTGVWISTDVEVQTDSQVLIGDGATIQRRCSINGAVEIGDFCIFAPNVFVSSGSHPFRAFPALPIREQERRLSLNPSDSVGSVDEPVWIQNDCWIGTNVVVSPGVTIGRGCVVGANAVVTHDAAPYSVLAGVPARVISQRLQWRPLPMLDPADENSVAYVLSGRRTQLADGNHAFQVSRTSGRLCAALSGFQRPYTVRIHYFSTKVCQILAGGDRISLHAGVGEAVVACGGLGTGEHLRFELALIDAGDVDSVFLTCLASSEDSPQPQVPS